MSDIRCDRCGAGSERIRELLAEIEYLRASRQDFKELAEKCCRVRDERDAEIEQLRAENAILDDVAKRTCRENERRTLEIAHLKGHCVERSDFEKDMI